MKRDGIVTLLGCLAAAISRGAPPLRLTHSWVVVTPGAPERRALEQAGFRIAPNGARRFTRLRVVAPGADRLPAAWLLDVTVDDGRQPVTRDLKPD